MIGNVFVDIKGGAFRPVHKDAKNVGKVNIVHGGAARNVVHNLAVLGARCRFVSSYTSGGLGDEVVSVLNSLQVDTSLMKAKTENGMGMWLAVLQPNGDLVASISEQPHLPYQEDTIFTALPEIVRDSSVIALDVGISKSVNERVIHACQQHGIPVYGLVGNLDVAEKYPQTLSGIDTFLCNAEEAAILAGHSVQSIEDAKRACGTIRRLGCRRVVVTMAEYGCVVEDASATEHVPAESVELVDSTGAGDSFFAGLLYDSIVHGHSLTDAARFAAGIAARVVASSANTLN